MTFILQLLQENSREQHSDLFAVLVDLSKAFDIVDRELLWKILWKFGCPANFVGVIKSFQDGMNASVLQLTLPVLLSVHNRTVYVRHKVHGLCLKMHALPPRNHYSTKRARKDLNHLMPLRTQ